MSSLDKTLEARKILQDTQSELAKQLETERRRARGEIMRQHHVISNMLTETPMYFSQAGQDRILDRFFGEKAGGVFADIGGFNGVKGSNTLFFEVFRKWNGILVEPSPTQLAIAQSVRRCDCLGYAVSGTSGQADFMEVTSGYTQMSGFLDSYNADLIKRVRAKPDHKEIIHTLDKKTLQDIFREKNMTKIDFVSLDVEGGEMDILSNFPFDEFQIEAWSIENNAQTSDLPQLMKANGYDLVEFAGVDDIYRKAKT